MSLLRPRIGGWAAMAEAATRPDPVRASVDADAIRHWFNWEWCFDPDNGAEGDTSWWWARSVRVDPDEVIADDGEGHLFSIPFTTDGTSEISATGGPQRVAETFVPVAAAEGAMATEVVRRRRQRVAATFTERPDKSNRPDPSNPAATADENEEASMTDEQRRALALSLGLAEDADETAIHEAAATRATAGPEVPDEPDEPATPAVETPEAELEPVAAAATIRQTLGLPATASEEDVARRVQEINAGAQAGTAARRAQLTAEMDSTVDQAVRDGRIAPSARDAWRTAIDPGENPDAAATARADQERAALAAMATNRVPVRERGAAPAAAENGSLSRALAAVGVNRDSRREPGQEVIRRG
jgi:hypothetical protein